MSSAHGVTALWEYSADAEAAVHVLMLPNHPFRVFPDPGFILQRAARHIYRIELRLVADRS
jgi:hypothetical protein